MKTIDNLIAEFDNILKLKNNQNYARLDNPLSATEIEHNFMKFGIDDQDMKLMYKWKNGWSLAQSKKYISIMKFGCFLSLESIALEIELNVETPLWDPVLVPIFNDYSGTYLLYNTKSSVDAAKFYLYSHSIMIEEPVTYFDSVQTMLETSIHAYHEKVFAYDESADFLDIDVVSFRKVAEKLNVKSEFWKKYSA